METKQTIPAGTKWGTLTYMYDVAGKFKNKRPIVVQCDCGVIKVLDLACLKNNTIGSCGYIRCLNKRKELLEKQIEAMNKRLWLAPDTKDLSELREYWNEIELTGNVHNIAKGLEMTTNFLKQ